MRSRVCLLWGVLLVLVSFGCAVQVRPTTAPPSPAVPVSSAELMVSVFAGVPELDSNLAGAEVSLRTAANPAGPSGPSDAAGNWQTRVPSPGDYDVAVSIAGYTCPGAHVSIVPGQGHAVVPISCVADAREVPVLRGRLKVGGRRIVRADGSPFVWRGATGFLLTERVLRGDEAGARAFLDALHALGFNVVRVIAMLPGGWEDGHAFSPEEGLSALPRTLTIAAERGFYVQLTVLNNTASLPSSADLGAYVQRAGEICAAFENCAVLEVANEPYHGVQSDAVHQVANLEQWARRVPAGPIVALGAPADDESTSHAGGAVATAHLSRDRDPWNMVRRVRELANVSETVGKPVISGEPDGFAEVACVPRKDKDGKPAGCYARQVNPSYAFAFGVLARLFEVPTNFHFEDGLRANVPGPVQTAAAMAFIAGTKVILDVQGHVVFQNADDTRKVWPNSPVAAFRAADGPPKANAAVRVYSAVAGAEGWTAVLGVQGDPGVVFRNGWRVAETVGEMPEIKVWRIVRQP